MTEFERDLNAKLESYYPSNLTPEQKSELTESMVSSKRFADWAYDWQQKRIDKLKDSMGLAMSQTGSSTATYKTLLEAFAEDDKLAGGE